MAGHSKWANTKHRKARVDAQKGKIFTKIAREISVAAREGGEDINSNFRLRLAVQKARESNMPNDNIQRAIQKGAGGQDGASFEQIMYEGYAAGGVAVLLELMTDNKNRTAAEIRHIFSRHNGSLGESGCVAWMFNRKGLITVNREALGMDEDDLMLLALEAGAEDVKTDDEDTYSIIAEIDSFEAVKEELQNQGVTIESFEVTMLPSNSIEITDQDIAAKIIKLMEALDDHDDVQNVYANFDMPDELLN
ncbi:MAG: YebC/PmpR family DNA-binding transcriptional regulator [Bacillota bacterium]|nr:YebC/PmpR family DNA-binding transcriptional regulator [Bacillota bacterium]MDW7728781.1 YebC/PmpR family DNA-binding transcriptional regulator [Bacillota bacterium]